MDAALYRVPASVLPRKTLTFEDGSSVVASFEESRNPEYLRLLGVDAKTIVLDLYALSPATLPLTVRPNSRATTTWHGQTVTLTVQGIYESQPEPEVRATGQRFWATVVGSV